MSRLFNRLLPIILIAAGVLWLALGIRMLHKHNEFPQATAVITDIQVEYGGADENDTYHVYVRYTADGSSYETELGSYTTGYKVGKELKISYNPDNPDDIQLAGIGESLYFVLGGPLISALGVLMLLRRIR